MGGFRRRLRRQAKEAAKQLLKQGIPANAIGRVVEDERIKRVLMRVVEGLEKKLDGGESPITVREGLAAIGTLLKINKEQANAIDQAQELEEQAALEEEIAANEEAAAALVEAKAAVVGATHGSPAQAANREPQTVTPESEALRAAG